MSNVRGMLDDVKTWLSDPVDYAEAYPSSVAGSVQLRKQYKEEQEMTGKKTNQQQNMERHDIKVGTEYMYGDHKVKVDYTFWDKYIPGSFALVDDPHLKEKRVVPVSDLSVVIPEEAINFVKAFNSVHENLMFYWVLCHVSRNRASLAAYFNDCHPKVTGQNLKAAMDYIMKEVHNEDPSNPSPSK